MPSCAYRNCKNTYDKHRSIYTFHRFPPKSNEELRKKWLLNCGLDEDFDCSRSRICSAHFKPEDFERDLKSELLGEPIKKRLKDNAEPSVNLTLIKNEPIEEFVHEIYPEIRPTFVLEQLAEVAVNRALDNDHFNNLSVQNNYNNREVVPVELIETNNVPQVASSVPLAPSSLPASQNWPGDYNFNVSFSQQEKSTKGVSWTYSKSLDKLYVGKDAPCPINFSTNTLMPENVKIRAIALYSSPESASEVVVRCVNHSLEEKSKNIFEAEHLVRCESSNVSYDIDPSTRRHSVLVPFENPPAGQLFSTYIYKFTCFGSCPFGPNRRPLMLVFTLEKGNQVLGRRKVDVKICACPGRDRKSDEQQASALEIGSSKKRKEPEFVSLSETMEFTKNVMLPVSKKSRHSQYGEGPYRLVVEDYECFEFLKQMKKLYDFSKIVKNIHPEMRKVLVHNHHQNKDHGSDA